jgi:inorganic triphosphatase YgiF
VLENEVKLTATSSFRLPPLDELVKGVETVAVAPQRLSATYYDTDDLRLARWGASLRRRTGEAWTVKLPVQAAGQLPAREEVTVPGPDGRPPKAAVDLVRAYVRTASLRPQVRLGPVRRRVELRDPQGGVLADQQAREEARAELLEALAGSRYLTLLNELVEAANAPMLTGEAQAPAKDFLPGLVRQPLRALRCRVKAFGGDPSEDELHQLRIRAKRVRYAADAVAPVTGRRARDVARAAARLQEVLGEHQDAVMAERWRNAWQALSNLHGSWS